MTCLTVLSTEISASDTHFLKKPRFFVDGVGMGRTDPRLGPGNKDHYVLLLDAAGLADGSHRPVARALDRQQLMPFAQDRFRVTSPANKTLQIDMIPSGYQLLSMHFDAAAGAAAGSDMTQSSTINSITFTQGSTGSNVHVWISSGLATPGNDGKHKLLLTYR